MMRKCTLLGIESVHFYATKVYTFGSLLKAKWTKE